MKLRALGIASIACLLSGTASATPKPLSDTNQAEKVFSGFFKVMGAPYQSGMPDQALRKKLQPYLSIELAQLLSLTAVREQQCLDAYSKINADITKKTPGGQAPATLKPPVFEGSIFTSSDDMPSRYKTIDAALPKANTLSLTIQYTLVDDGKPYNWRNSVLLIKQNGAWKIDNFSNEPKNKQDKTEKYDVKSYLKGFPSCEHDFEDYEKDNSH